MLTPCLRLPLLQLYVIPAPTSGEEALPPLAAPVQGLHLSDEGRPLWAVPGAEPGPDGGLDLGPAQVGLGVCGAGAGGGGGGRAESPVVTWVDCLLCR
jgi:hypothetical protein